jgi:WD40 repeat protein
VPDLAHGTDLRTLQGYQQWVAEVTMTPDGKWLISAAADTLLNVWEPERGEIVVTCTGASPLMCYAVAADSRTVIVGEQSGRAQMLHLEEVS